MQQNLNEKIVKESKAGIKKDRNSLYVVPRHADYLHLIFEEVIFNPMMPVFSIAVETSENQKSIMLATQGLLNLIIISAQFKDMQFQRDSTINALLNFANVKRVYESFSTKNI